MLRIAICDDLIIDLDNISNMVESLLYSLNVEYEIEKYNNGIDLLNSKISFDLILLDIEMDEINGIDIARELKKYNNDSKIIFILNSTNYLQIGYKVRADRYLIKPLDEQEFNYELTSVINNQIFDNKFIFDKRISQYKLYLIDIIYIDFFDRKTIIHKKNEKISTYITLKEWIALLNKYHFVRTHKAYIVNLRYIKLISTNKVTLLNNYELPLSRKYKDDFKNKYYTFIGEII